MSRAKEDCSCSDKKLHDVLCTEIYSYVFSKLPHRLINLRKREFELQDRPAVAKCLTSSEKLAGGVDKIKTTEREAFRHPGHKMPHLKREQLRDEAITRWVEHATKFTILSHTWERGELSYEDFRGQKDLSGSHLRQKDDDQTRSLEKLHNFCRIAKEYTEFAWADNICIDKSITPELDESIRSMFSWYHNAVICIIYLAGTSSLLDLACGDGDRWFTRGWTLQELLAPQRLKFYSKDWHRLTDFLNDKISKEDERKLRLLNDKSLSRQLDVLTGILLKQTGISIEHIRNFIPGIHHPSLPDRMRWVAQRSTTREEDQSYSLMGIFNVSISTAYGEGRERAFFRLFQAILEVGYQWDWFVWTGQSISPSIHPSRMIPSSPDCYVSFGPHAHKGGIGVLDEPVGLTNLGLRMTILFVPADVKESGELSRFHDYIPPHFTIACPSISNGTVEIRGIKRPHHPKHSSEEEFALGVLNVNLEEGGAQYPHRLYAILLQRTVARGSDSSTYGNWKKCDTDEIITFERYDKSKISKAEVEGPMVPRDTHTKRREERVRPKMSFRTMYL